MKIRKNPDQSTWGQLSQRPTLDHNEVQDIVSGIIRTVKKEGDRALFRFNKEFDGVHLADLSVSRVEMDAADKLLDESLKEAIRSAAKNIEVFHESQSVEESIVETMPGVSCWRQSRPIESIGLYIPGGTAPLFSTVLMLAIPARIAGCQNIVLCTPPDKNGEVHPAILFAAQLSGVTNIIKSGGAQAIAAMAFGTDSVPAVQKIFGPGNRFVTEAKLQVQQTGVAIDMPAGPSEVLVIADETANPTFVAADLISQAEHGPDSQVVLLTTAQDLIVKVQQALDDQLEDLPRSDVARQALSNSLLISFDQLSDALSFSNLYAPEHLILSVDNPRDCLKEVVSAGSVFLGHYSPESVGDYASGTNHTLPTNGYARAYSGVSLDSFVKKITVQELSKEGILAIGPMVETMAAAEQLEGHKRAVSVRLKNLKT